jgi:hypothetical protein
MFGRMLAIGEDGQPQTGGEWQITEEMRRAIDVLAAKLAKGVYWRHTQTSSRTTAASSLDFASPFELLKINGRGCDSTLSHHLGQAL